MKEIQKLYNKHLETPFPDLRGEEIKGIDLVLVDSESAGLVEKFFANRGQLNGDDYRILKQTYSELETVVKQLENKQRLYFFNLLNIVGRIIEFDGNKKISGLKARM